MAERCVVRHTQRPTEQADNRADQPFSLPIGEAEHGPQRQRRQRIPGLTTPRRPRFRCPSRDCVVGKPHRQTATPTQTGFIGRPVSDFALPSWNVVVGILVHHCPLRRDRTSTDDDTRSPSRGSWRRCCMRCGLTAQSSSGGQRWPDPPLYPAPSGEASSPGGKSGLTSQRSWRTLFRTCAAVTLRQFLQRMLMLRRRS
jgi:hypothetical protein